MAIMIVRFGRLGGKPCTVFGKLKAKQASMHRQTCASRRHHEGDAIQRKSRTSVRRLAPRVWQGHSFPNASTA